MRLFYNPPGPDAEVAVESTTSLPVPILHEPEFKEKPSEVVIIDSQQAWDQALREVKEAGICGLDLETTGLDPLVARVRLIQMAIPKKVFVTDVRALQTAVLDDLASLMEDDHVTKVIHNAKSELSMIQASQVRRLRVKNVFCTMQASQVCSSGYYSLVPAPKAIKFPRKRSRIEHNLEALAKRHLGLKMDKSCQTSDWSSEILSHEQMQYAAKDAEVLLPLYDILQELLQKNNLEHVAELEFKALSAVVEIELTGLPIDAQATRSMMEAKRNQAQILAHELQEEAQTNGYVPRPKKGKKAQKIINPDSHMDVLGYLQHIGHKINSSKEEDLKALNCPWAAKLLQYRRTSRQKKFLEDWLLRISPVDNKLHAQYFQCSTVSGRFSCTKPNAQQIPKRGEDGQAMRKLFKAPPGRKIVKADFSGIELRIMAKLSNDKTMIEAFKAGQDLHKLTASKIAGIPLDQVTKDQRQSAKSANFGLIHGVSASRFRENAKNEYGIEMSPVEAEKIRSTFFATHPSVLRWHQRQRGSKYISKVHYKHDAKHGFYSGSFVSSQTVYGRKRIWGWFNGKTLAKETELFNSPSQGTGADLIKIAMVALREILFSEKLDDVKIVGSIHDELLLEAPEALAEKVAAILGDVMKSVGSNLLYPVPVDAEVEVLSSWGGD